ncbi:MAG TPA: SusC/RagA family TonB-linked outer membrane protein [Gemmatimonadaceae bacterium]|nr:SusC/RagA family TonB-linked outer membrane protein [Gemmatimonadaceae bacterium]
MRGFSYAVHRASPGTTSPPRRARLGRWGAAACCLILGATTARAQGVVAGTVTNPGQAPVQSAQVTVRGTRLGSLTDDAGHFTISGVSGTTVTLDVRRLGYRGDTATVSVGDQNIHITLTPAAINLNTVVVTGTPGATEKRKLGVSVAQIDVTNAVAKAPVEDVQQVLNGRAPGVAIVQNSGMVGSGANVTVRGLSTFSLSTQPLVYVDGVRVDNSQATGPTNQAFGASTTTRWNDINPQDIQSIEIVKGPAATSLYGTQASNGVIQIITKKGAEGKARWDFTTRQGVNWFSNPSGRLWVNYGPDSTGVITSIDQYDRYKDKGINLFKNGPMQDYNLGIGGGTSSFRYHVDGGFRDDNGVIPGNKQHLYNARANLSIIPSDKVDVTTSLGYVTGRTDLAYESGAGGLPWTLYYATPTHLYGTHANYDGFYSVPPYVYYDLISDWQNIDRFTGSVQINHHPTNWFSQRLTIGGDIIQEYSEELDQVDHELAKFQAFEFSADSGYVAINTRHNNLMTASYNASITLPLTSHLTSTTTGGGDLYRRTTNFSDASGQDFPAPGLTSLSSTTALRTGGQTLEQQNSIGLLLQEQLGWNDRLYLTGGFRVDNNSAFGANFNRVYYPKVSASWVISDEPFFHLPAVSQLKLRAAYGQSGLAPVPYSAVPTFTAFVGPNGAAVVTPQSIGNPDLAPEKGYETELGFDAGLFNDRAGIEFTFFTGGTKDAILERQVAPSLGFPGTQFVNAGRISKHGIEFLLRGTPIETPSTSWDLTVSGGWNHTNVDDLGGEEFIVPSRYIEYHVGYPVGAWFGPKVVSASLDSTGHAINVMCAGGPDNGNKPVPCLDSNGNLVGPNVYLGRTTPSFEGSVSSTVRIFTHLSIYGLMDFKTGYSKLDGNRRVRCHLFGLCRIDYFPQDYNPVEVAGVQNEIVGDLVSSSNFAKIREVSATYDLPERWASRVGASRAAISVAGRNLFTWTAFKGLEPEASFEGGSRGGLGQWEQDVLPQLTQFVATVNLTF